ncbi:flagellar FlbD family protein [Halobacillus salinarum]|uniref:Flagellar FlbD family protein n=1 Tax=Halobacillus salinarum TaxID=2932257 RepID=A0ABY4EG55_9BACI|nr:flagellar FlbD family protein [Halobacillus salinarum]UOQ43048.1 flagellar FlbD family protein [Halobacillus salinarum]
MIALTRLNGESFYFNALYIEQVQSNPDTTITTTKGRKFVVKEAEDLVIERMMDFYQKLGLITLKDKAGEEEREA